MRRTKTVALGRPQVSSRMLTRLLDDPTLPSTLRAMPAQRFAALVREVGVADAGELVALASTEQLVAAFDEDLFVNTEPGEREIFDGERFVVWLEVLREAGEELMAERFASLSLAFALQAICSMVFVLDNEELMLRMAEGGQSAFVADKALESALTEELEGFLLVARREAGWDAILALILALDRNERALLETLLERAAAVTAGLTQDLDELVTALSAEASLAEDVEDERRERRGRQGFVDPQDARAFLALARRPIDRRAPARDAITAAYFRHTEPAAAGAEPARAEARERRRPLKALLPAGEGALAVTSDKLPLFAALGALQQRDPALFDARMQELVFVSNVLVAGAKAKEGRLAPLQAAEAALLTVAFGAELAARGEEPAATAGWQQPVRGRPTVEEVDEVLNRHALDYLYRLGSGTLVQWRIDTEIFGVISSRAELSRALASRGQRRG